MALHERIAALRRENGWSQENLAERLGVSRQSVSKWESGSAQPELDKVLAMSRLFGVTTDSLLTDALPPASRIAEPGELTEADARAYLNVRRRSAVETAWGVALCVASPVPLMVLECIDRPRAEAVGVVVLLELVALAVYLFIIADARLKALKELEKGKLSLSGDAAEAVRAGMEAFKARHTQSVAFGVGLCVVSPVPVTLAGIMDASEAMLTFCSGLLLLVVAGATYLFVRDDMILKGMKKLLKRAK